MECAVQSYPGFLASGNGLSQSSGNEIACYKVDEANRLATSCPNQSDIVCTQQVDGNKLAATCYEQPVSYSLVGTTCIKTVTVNQGDNNLFQTYHNNWKQAVRTHRLSKNLVTTNLLQLVSRSVTTCAFLRTIVKT
jgi:hypothetical protein